jgi:hypothetical protein
MEQFMQVLHQKGLDGEVINDKVDHALNDHGQVENKPITWGIELFMRLVGYIVAEHNIRV